MKKIVWFCMMVLTPFLIDAQIEKRVDSNITDVTVFLSKAQVSREIKTRLDVGKTSLVVSGLTSFLDPQSIQVSGKGNFMILGIAHQQNFLNEFNVPSRLKSLKDSAETLQKLVGLEQSQKEILNKEEQMLLSNQKIGGTNQNLTAAELKAMADFYRTRLTEIVNARLKHDERIKKLTEQLGKVQRQVNEQNELYQRNTSEVVITVSADNATGAEFQLSYIVSQAGWNAIYDLRATNTKSPVQLNYKANVYQATGEEWKNVKLKLSTANPNLGGLKPELYSWYLNFDQPVYRPAKRITIGAAQKSAAPSTAMDKADVYEEAESVAEYVTTTQTSLNTEFIIGLPYTVSSNNKPTTVDIRSHELKAIYLYSVVPKLEPDVFLLAKITGWEDYSLIPGEANVFFEGTFVAKTYIDPENIKDTLSVSLGRDKRIIVKREKLKDFTSRKLIGTNQRDAYAYEISIRNAKAEPIKILIEDQIPVSQNSQIEVSLTDTGNAKYNTDLGKLSWRLQLQPNETKKVTYKYEVKYPKDKVISNL